MYKREALALTTRNLILNILLLYSFQFDAQLIVVILCFIPSGDMMSVLVLVCYIHSKIPDVVTVL